jgi:phosphoglycolate phosphatase
VLWDVDGTLLHPGPGVVMAYEQAVASALRSQPPHGGRTPRPPISDAMAVELTVGGKTDPEVCLELLRSAGLTIAEARVRLPFVLRSVEERLLASSQIMQEEGRVMPGAQDVLATLHAHGHVMQSVLTGNTAANARTKLSALGLTPWLDLEVGAFGSDNHDRKVLVNVALTRVRERHGLTFRREDVWVVGDTPLDLACARAAGVRCVLVGTGHHPLDELGKLEPDALLADLSRVERVVALLAG